MKFLCTKTGFLLLLLLLASCNGRYHPAIELKNVKMDTSYQAKVISMEDLVQHFKKMNGEVIQTAGIVYFEFENVSICLKNGKELFCLWLDADSALYNHYDTLSKLSGRRCIVKGTIDTADKGHLNGYAGSIRNVYYIKSEK